MYKKEAKKLCEIFGTEIEKIYHIGSTSVDGLISKPVIDIMPVVKDIERVDEFNNAMINAGYEPKGENGLSDRRFFQKGGSKRTHHIHFYEIDNPAIDRHLAFRNYLRSHPDAVKKYGRLKKELSQRFPDNIEAYIKGKEQLVSEIEKKAMYWCQNSKSD